MLDPIAPNEAVRSLLDAYRVFLQEMRNVGQAKGILMKSIIARLDAERVEDARKKLKDLSYERNA